MFDWVGTLTGAINQGMAVLATKSDRALELAIALAAVGVAAMAITQMFKDTLRLHKLFNVLSIRMWIDGPTSGRPAGAGSLVAWPAAFAAKTMDRTRRFAVVCSRDDHREKVWSQLTDLATAGDVEALHTLAPSSLMGQVAAASRVAVASPTEYAELLQTLVGRAGAAGLLALNAASAALAAAKKDVQQASDGHAQAVAALHNATVHHAETGTGQEAVKNAEATADAARRVLDAAKALEGDRQMAVDAARTRVSYFIERNIDAFQINLASRWERWNRVAAFGVSFLLVLAFLSTRGGNIMQAVPMAVLAAFIAPVAKDLVISLQKLRGRAA